MSSILDSQFTNCSVNNSNISEDYPSLSKINLSQTIDVQNAKLISPSITTESSYYNKNNSNNSLNKNYDSEKVIIPQKPTQNYHSHQNYHNKNYSPNFNQNDFSNQIHRQKHDINNENMNRKYNYKNPGLYDRNNYNRDIPPKFNYPPYMGNQYMHPPPPFGFLPQGPSMYLNYPDYQNYQPNPFPPENYGPYRGGNYYGYY